MGKSRPSTRPVYTSWRETYNNTQTLGMSWCVLYSVSAIIESITNPLKPSKCAELSLTEDFQGKLCYPGPREEPGLLPWGNYGAQIRLPQRSGDSAVCSIQKAKNVTAQASPYANFAICSVRIRLSKKSFVGFHMAPPKKARSARQEVDL